MDKTAVTKAVLRSLQGTNLTVGERREIAEEVYLNIQEEYLLKPEAILA